MRLRVSTILFATLLTARSAAAATLTGVVTDTTGGVLGGATVVLRGVATGEERGVETADDGRFTLSTDTPGYLVIVRRSGFSDAARTGSSRPPRMPSTWRWSSRSASSAPRRA